MSDCNHDDGEVFGFLIGEHMLSMMRIQEIIGRGLEEAGVTKAMLDMFISESVANDFEGFSILKMLSYVSRDMGEVSRRFVSADGD